MNPITVYKVVAGPALIDSFTTQQWLTSQAALEKARARRDRYNQSELVQSGKGPSATIIRSRRQSTARPL